MTQAEAIENIKLIRFNAAITNANSFKEALDMAITALSQPSLPSDLDEAMEEESQHAYGEPTAQGFAKRSFFKRGFKAGAEWMAGQGETREVEVKEDTGGYPYIKSIELYDYDNDEPLFKPGDKVVVQIRKK